MLPATKAIQKEMLPLVDKPLIQDVVEETVAAGITEIVLLTHSSKNSIENHFETSFELKNQPEKPDIEDASSNLAITGRYVLSAKVWDLLRHKAPGAGGAIRLTDALHHLLLIEKIEAYHL